MDNLRIFPKIRKIPEKKPKSFILFPFELIEKQNEPLEAKEAESLELIKNHLKEFKRPYIATSHGKDSIVLVHLVFRAAKELGVPMPDCFLNNTLNLFPEEMQYWKEFNKWLGIEKQFKEFKPPKDDKGKFYTVWSVAEKFGHLPHSRATARHVKGSYKQTATPECCDYLKKKSVYAHLKKLKKETNRYDLAIVGELAEESNNRSLNFLQRCRSFVKKYRTPYPIQTLKPLGFWRKTDIYLYIDNHKLPKNPAYQNHNLTRMGCASCPAYLGWEIDQLKDPTGFRFNFLKRNLEFMKNTEPERFEKSIHKIEKYIKTSASKTELTTEIRQKAMDLLQQSHKTLKD